MPKARSAHARLAAVQSTTSKCGFSASRKRRACGRSQMHLYNCAHARRCPVGGRAVTVCGAWLCVSCAPPAVQAPARGGVPPQAAHSKSTQFAIGHQPAHRFSIHSKSGRNTRRSMPPNGTSLLGSSELPMRVPSRSNTIVGRPSVYTDGGSSGTGAPERAVEMEFVLRVDAEDAAVHRDAEVWDRRMRVSAQDCCKGSVDPSCLAAAVADWSCVMDQRCVQTSRALATREQPACGGAQGSGNAQDSPPPKPRSTARANGAAAHKFQCHRGCGMRG